MGITRARPMNTAGLITFCSARRWSATGWRRKRIFPLFPTGAWAQTTGPSWRGLKSLDNKLDCCGQIGMSGYGANNWTIDCRILSWKPQKSWKSQFLDFQRREWRIPSQWWMLSLCHFICEPMEWAMSTCARLPSVVRLRHWCLVFLFPEPTRLDSSLRLLVCLHS